MRSYTGNETYKNINGVLRGRADSFDPGNLEIARDLHDALSRASLSADCVVYRGASEAALGPFQNLPNEMLLNGVIADKGFMSTSLERGSAFEDEVLLEILAPKGSHGAYVGHISSAGHYEKEVLFDAGQRMRILEAFWADDGRRIVRVEIF